ncbi:MAG: IS630 transposase-related protein [Alphaproteobacteria bacterium]
MSYSIDFRRKVLDVREKEGLSMESVAARFGVCVASVMRWTKEISPKRTRYKPPKIDMEALLSLDVETHSDAYLRERAARFFREHHLHHESAEAPWGDL